MKKLIVIILLQIGSVLSLYAAHIKGGELAYEYVGPGSSPNRSIYRLILKLYIDCGATSPGQLDGTVNLTIFRKDNNSRVDTLIAPMTDETFLRFDPASNPCIGNPPLDVCYRIRTYTVTTELENIPSGYIVAFQRCCRIIDIRNLAAPSNSYGATYMAEIPGTGILPDAYKNSSPKYQTADASAICQRSNFLFSFGAVEPDGDSLVYALCSGFIGGSQAVPSPTAASTPPYTNLSYSNFYTGSAPLGGQVTINRFTGLVRGIAPAQLGQYVITACAYEYRRGQLINIHRKDIHIAVSDCIPLQALLEPEYSFCDDFNVTFKNEQRNPAGAEYTWDFGDGSPTVTNSDIEGRVTHQYADTGTYTVKLKVVLAGQCVDETTTLAKVYPGFFPGFTSLGSCLYTPFAFTDTTRARYGTVSRWSWSFGDETSEEDIANAKTPNWKYSSLGIKTVTLEVESDKGCKGTVTKDIEVRDVPLMSMAFRDTIICSIDSLQLGVSGNGILEWTPNVNILNRTTRNPIVFPKSTTTYRVSLNENGCVNNDSVRVRVVDFVTLNAGPDTTICATDSIRLRPISDGTRYTWTPGTAMGDPFTKNPMVAPAVTTTYQVEARIGKCAATDNLTIRTVPYPFVNAGPDTTVCFQDTASLHAAIIGSRFNWSPTSSLSSGNTLNPKAFPATSTTYRLTAYDTIGCPKPGFDEVIVGVRDQIIAFAGNDTSIVVGQPLLLSGAGAELFQWTPSFGLDQPNSRTPVATLENNMTYVLRAFTPEGCFALDTIAIRVFKTRPDIFVPNAFAPDGYNKILKPEAPGISKLEYFRVFNRWGQMVFQTSQIGKGWDGSVSGKIQDSGTYVWMVSGTDFTGKKVVKKGTATLIR